MVAHNDNFCRGIALVLQGESLKAGSYVTHPGSLGTLREKMVSNFVRHETPERFRVETGLIRRHDHNSTSRQCDLLVHDPCMTPPLYRWEDFVIVHASAARAVIEVKSELNQDSFRGILDNHLSVLNLQLLGGGVFIPTFGYGLSGVTFGTFIEYVKEALLTNRLNAADGQTHLNMPFCIAVQSRNYVGLRPLQGNGDKPFAFCVADLSKATDNSAKPVEGIETGFFLQIYSEALRSRLAFEDSLLYEWFNKLPIEADGKIWVTPDGVAHKGTI